MSTDNIRAAFEQIDINRALTAARKRGLCRYCLGSGLMDDEATSCMRCHGEGDEPSTLPELTAMQRKDADEPIDVTICECDNLHTEVARLTRELDQARESVSLLEREVRGTTDACGDAIRKSDETRRQRDEAMRHFEDAVHARNAAEKGEGEALAALDDARERHQHELLMLTRAIVATAEKARP